MPLLRPKPTPYDPLEWQKSPFAERARLACRAWVLDGYGPPLAVYALHVLKVGLYIGGWVLACSRSPSLGGLSTLAQWWLAPLAFQKAVLWSMLFEGLGLGCGFGPLTGRYFPPVGGPLYFARPGTTKLPLFPGLPLLGGSRRGWLDVALYLGVIALLVRALLAPSLDGSILLPIAVAVPLLGIADRTVFLALRAEHYWTLVVCFVLASDWMAGAKAVTLALWFWAGISKLNHHFPAVVCVMISNGPFTPFAWLRRRMYRRFPDDLRPSRLAVVMAHAGTALELGVPLTLATSPGGWSLVAGIAMAMVLHAFITSTVPMGVPIEWNVMVVYSVFALFWSRPEVGVLALASAPLLAAFLAVMLIALPLLGNLRPARVSFLMAMRYYAGNWPYGIWLFRGTSYRKLDRLTKAAPWLYDQLERFYDRATAVGIVGKVMAWRTMHLQGRSIAELLPKAVSRFEDYEFIDGEIVAGLALGYNFGDGHLHTEQLLASLQEQCDFEEGELRCIFVESQPLGMDTMAYRILDAKTGLRERGELDVRTLRERQPWGA